MKNKYLEMKTSARKIRGKNIYIACVIKSGTTSEITRQRTTIYGLGATRVTYNTRKKALEASRKYIDRLIKREDARISYVQKRKERT